MLIQMKLLVLLLTGKILIIGGGIANFTNVSATFKVNRNTVLLSMTSFLSFKLLWLHCPTSL